MNSATRDDLPQRADFRTFRPLQTRWLDNDHYGHVNNVVYYSYFDTAVNGWLIDATGTDIRALPQIGLVVETSCRFLASLSFPESIDVGLRVEKIGTSSIVYAIGIFRSGSNDCAALGKFVHVYVDAQTRKTTPIPAAVRNAAETLR